MQELYRYIRPQSHFSVCPLSLNCNTFPHGHLISVHSSTLRYLTSLAGRNTPSGISEQLPIVSTSLTIPPTIPRLFSPAIRTHHDRWHIIAQYHIMHMHRPAPAIGYDSQDVFAMMTVPLRDRLSCLVDRGGLGHGILPFTAATLSAVYGSSA